MHNRQCLVWQHDSHETYMFRIKICGITQPEDARIAVDAGADALGFNFFAGSKRYINFLAARELVEADSLDCMKVGVFVNHTADELNEIAQAVGLDAVQLHGDQPPPVAYGGTGERLDWTTLADRIELLNFDRAEPLRLILAGGLTPANVAEAIRLVRPYGVDVASGVESTPGRKDPAKVRAFVAEARRGFAEIARQ
jgi:phosphoribosylanthranilate isomerase